MAAMKIDKVVSSLPDPLDADTVYAVRVGEGFDLYISNSDGTAAYKLNTLNIVVSDTEPASPAMGLIWVDTS